MKTQEDRHGIVKRPFVLLITGKKKDFFFFRWPWSWAD